MNEETEEKKDEEIVEDEETVEEGMQEDPQEDAVPEAQEEAPASEDVAVEGVSNEEVMSKLEEVLSTLEKMSALILRSGLPLTAVEDEESFEEEADYVEYKTLDELDYTL